MLVAALTAAALFGACKKDEAAAPENNVLAGTTWQRENLAGNAIWGGENVHRLHFKDNSNYEILNVRNGSVRDLSQEGTYTFSDGEDLALSHTTSKGEARTDRYRLVDSRTLGFVQADGKVGTASYQAFVKQ